MSSPHEHRSDAHVLRSPWNVSASIGAMPSSIECFWPGVEEASLAEAIERTTRDPAAQCFDSILIPADEIVLCLFEGVSEQAVRDASRRAGLPSERVVECVQLVPERSSTEEEVS
jgi:Protein of unknown function (DUF4242)